MPNRPHSMDHVLCPQPVAFCDLHVARLASVQLPAFAEQVRPRGAMNRPIDSASPEKRGVRRIDDCINFEGGDVGPDGRQAGLSHDEALLMSWMYRFRYMN